MTTGEWLISLSSAQPGSTALDVVTNITGTYPVLTPVQEFTTSLDNIAIDGNLDIISISANVDELTVDANLDSDNYSADIILEEFDVNIN